MNAAARLPRSYLFEEIRETPSCDRRRASGPAGRGEREREERRAVQARSSGAQFRRANRFR